jgi:hypothetical protein
MYRTYFFRFTQFDIDMSKWNILMVFISLVTVIYLLHRKRNSSWLNFLHELSICIFMIIMLNFCKWQHFINIYLIYYRNKHHTIISMSYRQLYEQFWLTGVWRIGLTFSRFSLHLFYQLKTLFCRLVRLFWTTQIAQRGSLAASSLLQKFPPTIWLAFCFLSQNFSAETDYF